MVDVDDPGGRRDSQYDAVTDSDELVFEAVVGEEGDDARAQDSAPGIERELAATCPAGVFANASS
jgi:hypothetical protein